MTLNVLLLVPGGTKGPGGISRMVDNFVQELSAQRPDLKLQVVDTYGRGKLDVPFKFLVACLLTSYLCASRRVDLVHIHMAAHASIVRKLILVNLCSVLGTPVILHVHGGRFDQFYVGLPRLLQNAITKLMRSSSLVIALGHYWREFLVNTVRCDPGKVVTLNNAVRGPDVLLERQKCPVHHLLFLGKLVKHKGIDELLQAAADPRMREYQWQMQIAGDGDVERFRQKAEALGLSDRVHFLGAVSSERVPGLLTANEILLCPSLAEGLPMSILEAMAYGLSIVATPVGSVAEAVQDGENGLLVAPGDSRAIATALVTIMENSSLEQQMRYHSRELYLEKFDIRIFVKRLAKLYEATASLKSGGGHHA